MPHIHHQYDYTVGLFIVHNGKILLINHPRYGKWMTPGGHIELHEDPEQAVYREALEETGLKVRFLTPAEPSKDGYKPLPVPQFLDSHDANPPHKHIAFCYVLLADSNTSVMSDEHTDMKWVSKQELEDDTSMNVTVYQKQQFYKAIDLTTA